MARERQAVFEEAFVSQIEEYKQTGSIPSITTLNPIFIKFIISFIICFSAESAIRITTNLDEVVVDEDPGALDQFLNDIE